MFTLFLLLSAMFCFSQTDSLTIQIRLLTEKIEQLNKIITACGKQQLEAKDSIIRELQNQLSFKDKEINLLKQKILSNNLLIIEKDSIIDLLNIQLATKEKEIGVLNGRIIKKNDTIAAMRKDIDLKNKALRILVESNLILSSPYDQQKCDSLINVMNNLKIQNDSFLLIMIPIYTDLLKNYCKMNNKCYEDIDLANTNLPQNPNKTINYLKNEIVKYYAYPFLKGEIEKKIKNVNYNYPNITTIKKVNCK